jgi:TetR/AcrR family transcriptional regulator, transcriptional repressor for nem operon
MSEMTERLLDAAEVAIRSRGYHGVSFRELANDVGVKSASVHYYFPQKENLAVTLVERYSKQFFSTLNQVVDENTTSNDLLRRFCAAYRSSLERSERACLCGMLGAESSGLPPAVASAVASFFEANITWISRCLPTTLPSDVRRARAIQVLASLQGGMMIATTLHDLTIFDTVIRRIVEDSCV